MKKVSHSEITTYLDCQKKWDLIYNQKMKVDNVHFQFGSMGHKVLETGNIPDELMYQELKDAFGIESWKDYFKPIFKELADYFKDYDVIAREMVVETKDVKGVIDVVWRNKYTGRLLITDYKFSTGNKGVVEISLDEQMYIYAMAYSLMTGEPLTNIDLGYISIPKAQLFHPRILKNGQLSKDLSQKTTYNLYLESIHEQNLNEEDYADVLDALKDKTFLNIVTTSLNIETAVKIAENIDLIIKDMQKGYILEKFSYMCSKCEFMRYCKYNKHFEISDEE